jgi:phospholipase D1/2
MMKAEIKRAKRQAFLQQKELNPTFAIAVKFLKQKRNGTCRCQVLRSSCNWSTGLRIVEHSILNAYVDLIKNAKKFLYIENQFFMSNASKGGVMKNNITRALCERIEQAHLNKENFKIFVFVPLMPGFEGDIVERESQVLKFQVKFQQETITKGPTSMYTVLQRKGINPTKYIRFFGIRNHAIFSDGPKQEMIYIHSKCMIVDDRYIIIGSANINDRSTLGKRDSEVCLLTEDEDFIDSELDGENVKVGRAVQAFRKQLMGGTNNF